MKIIPLLACLLALAGAGGCHSSKQSAGESGSGSSQKSSTGQSNDTGGGEQGGKGGEEKSSSLPVDAVKIKADDQAKAGIRVEAVKVESVPQLLNVAGQVALNEKATQHLGAVVDGRIDSVYVVPGDFVRKGQLLATLHSHAVHETVMALTQAFADVARQTTAVAFATQNRDRYDRLYQIQAASLEEKQRSEQDLAQARKNLVDAEASVRAEREHLSELLQVSPSSLQPNNLGQKELIPIRAGISGFVISRSVTPGQVVNTGDETFVVSDLSSVWVNGAVGEQNMIHAHPGALASVTMQGEPDHPYLGRVNTLGDMVDPETRTLPVRIVVANPGTHLRAGMFVSVNIQQDATRTAIFIPESAIQDVNGFQAVFVTRDGVTFYARTVKLGARYRGQVEILDGLQAADKVVSQGAFMVKGEMLKGSVGEG